MTSPLIDVASVDQIPPGAVMPVMIPTGTVALFNVDGRIFAVDDACVRCGASLACGHVDGPRVVCRCGWQYELSTGCVSGVPALRTDRFEVTVVGTHVMVGTEPLGPSR